MRARRIASFLILLAFLPLARAATSETPAPSWTPEGPATGADLRILLVTAGPGQHLATRWGHSGILVADDTRGIALFYNYGHVEGESIDVPAGILLGASIFSVEAFDAQASLKAFRDDGRSVVLRELRLAPEARLGLARQLVHDTLPQNKHYRYDPFLDNCATRVRDTLDAATNGALGNATRALATGLTPRDAGRGVLADDGAFLWVSDLLMGSPPQRPASAWDLMFLPSELDARVTNLTLGDGQPFVVRSTVYAIGPPTIISPPTPARLTGALVAGVLLGALAVVVGSLARRGGRWKAGAVTVFAVLSLTGGAVGVLLLAWDLQGGTGAANGHAIALSPFLLLPGVFVLLRRDRLFAITTTVAAALGLLSLVVVLRSGQSTAPTACLVPALVGMSIGAWLAARGTRPSDG